MSRIFLASFLSLFFLVSCSHKIVKKSVSLKKMPSKSISKIQTKSNKKTEVLTATSNVKVTSETIGEYINQYKGIAIVQMKRYGVPASITLAQGILESGSGLGRLARVANNHFGIKCHNQWEGESVTHDDDEIAECFRKYKDPIQSFEDHSLFLKNRKRYAFLFSLSPLDYKAWAKGLKKAGYATDPKYPDKLISLIERYQLYHYDYVSTDKEAVSENEYIVQKGDTLYSIARKFQISVKELMQKNGLTDNKINIGQKLLIKKS